MTRIWLRLVKNSLSYPATGARTDSDAGVAA
jgi:hypothetical protein